MEKGRRKDRLFGAFPFLLSYLVSKDQLLSSLLRIHSLLN